jgi:hypothetical protein
MAHLIAELNKRLTEHKHVAIHAGLLPALAAAVVHVPELAVLVSRAHAPLLGAELPLEYHAIAAAIAALQVTKKRARPPRASAAAWCARDTRNFSRT